MRVVADMQAERNRQIMHSIDYASTIQRAMLRTSRECWRHAARRALVWEPRDVVGGDFYHFAAFEDGWFAALADCTGHGVPGAFMTLIASSLLTQALEQMGRAIRRAADGRESRHQADAGPERPRAAPDARRNRTMAWTPRSSGSTTPRAS
jgi:hypothetical protein